MAKFQITNLNPAASTLAAPGKVNLKFNITGDIGTAVTLTYTLNPGSTVYFDAKPKKTISQNITLDISPKPVNDAVNIVKDGTPDFPSADIAIDAKTGDGNVAGATYQITFS